MKVICACCGRPAVLVKGNVIYPHRADLHALNFWECSPCGAYVGCHRRGTFERTNGKKIVHHGDEPLGRLANAALRQAKQAAHAAFDPLWKSKRFSTRKHAYAWLAEQLGVSVENCHIGMFDVAGCEAVIAACARLGDTNDTQTI